MAGSIIGVQKRIQTEYPKALYVHCFAHKLSLAVFTHFEHKAIRDLLMILQKGGAFFKTPKRRTILEEHKETRRGPRTLKVPIITRWTEVGRVTRDLKKLFGPAVHSLRSFIQDNQGYSDKNVRAVAEGLQLTMLKPSFVLTLVVSDTLVFYIWAYH